MATIKPRRDVKQEITDKIIELLEAGTDAWKKTWEVAANNGMPVNALTGAPYRGVNVIVLFMASAQNGYTSNKWMTYKQAQSVGAQVRKGEKSVTGVFFDMVKKRAKEEGEEDALIPMAKAFYLFNLDQIDNLPEAMKEAAAEPRRDFNRIEEAEAFLGATGAVISHGGNRAFYRPSTDEIRLPEPEAFISPENYYATALHELTHWTGHASRLDRDFSKHRRFGDEHYAFEELVAELGAAYLCGEFGFIDATVENHASYLASWIKVLKNDKNAIFTAAKHASAAYDFLQNLAAPAKPETETEPEELAA